MSSHGNKAAIYVTTAGFIFTSALALILIIGCTGDEAGEPVTSTVDKTGKTDDTSPRQTGEADKREVAKQKIPAVKQETERQEEVEQKVIIQEVEEEGFVPLPPPPLKAAVELSKRDLQPLIEFFREANPFLESDYVRRAGRKTEALKRGGRTAWDVLEEAFEKEEDELVRGRFNAVMACMRWGFSPYYVWELDENFLADLYADRMPPKGKWYSSLETLFKADDAGKLIHSFTLNDPHASYYIFEFLDKMESKALKPLLEALSNEHRYFAFCVRIALMRITPGLIDELKAMTGDENPGIRSRAAWALGLSNSQEAIVPLCRMLKDEEPVVRSNAAYMLGMIPSRRSVKHLVEMLKYEDSAAAYYSAQALGIIGDPAAIELLTVYIENGAEDAKKEGTSALAGIGEKALAQLVKFLNSEEPVEREAAAYAIAQLDSSSALEPILASTRDESDDVRAAAAYALGKMGGPKARDTLHKMLKDESPEIRSSAAYALGDMRSRESAEDLADMLDDPDARVRMAAFNALSRVGGAIALVKLAESLESPEFAPLAVDGLKKYGRAAGPVLVDIFPKLPTEGKCTASRLLAGIGYSPAVPMLIDHLMDTDIDVRFCAQKALKLITGHETSYKCDDNDKNRIKGQKEWRQWWVEQKKEKR